MLNKYENLIKLYYKKKNIELQKTFINNKQFFKFWTRILYIDT